MTTKHADALTLKDRLSRLSFVEASKLLGGNGAKLIRQGGKFEVDPANVSLEDRRLQVDLPNARVTVSSPSLPNWRRAPRTRRNSGLHRSVSKNNWRRAWRRMNRAACA